MRGADRRNPVLLMLHGGPGYVAMPTSWYFQRGAGKTYAANDPAVVAPTMTRARGLGHYGGAVYNRRGFDAESAAVRLAPEYSDAELRTLWEAGEFSSNRLLAETIAMDFSGMDVAP
ncbi:hypothetical protein LPN04_32485 [Rugamonas sp. A1-17]|nr:hypothetical protein [Rugamonas sp. A1-17]